MVHTTTRLAPPSAFQAFGAKALVGRIFGFKDVAGRISDCRIFAPNLWIVILHSSAPVSVTIQNNNNHAREMTTPMDVDTPKPDAATAKKQKQVRFQAAKSEVGASCELARSPLIVCGCACRQGRVVPEDGRGQETGGRGRQGQVWQVQSRQALPSVRIQAQQSPRAHVYIIVYTDARTRSEPRLPRSRSRSASWRPCATMWTSRQSKRPRSVLTNRSSSRQPPR